MTRNYETDVIVVGGGPAGLSAGVYLARYRRGVALFDLEQGRSTYHQINHNYLGFPHGIRAVDLRQRGLEQLTEYDHVRVEQHWVDRLERTENCFLASGEFGTTRARAVILCTGVLEHYPRFQDWEAYVGLSMFWCITCDGYESRDKTIVVAGHTNGAAGEALQMSRFSDDVTLLTNASIDEIDDTCRQRLAAAGVPIIQDKLRRVTGENGQLHSLETEGGLVIPVERFFVVQEATPRTELGRMLGVELGENGYILVNDEQKTSVEGVYAAGDITQLHSHQISAAVHEGAQAASAANDFLVPPELRVG